MGFAGSATAQSEFEVTFEGTNENGVIAYTREDDTDWSKTIRGEVQGPTDDIRSSLFEIRYRGAMISYRNVNVSSDGSFEFPFSLPSNIDYTEFTGVFEINGETAGEVDIEIEPATLSSVVFDNQNSDGAVKIQDISSARITGSTEQITDGNKELRVKDDTGSLIETVTVDVSSNGEFVAVINAAEYSSTELLLEFYDGDDFVEETEAIIISDVEVTFNRITGAPNEVNANDEGILEVKPWTNSLDYYESFSFTGTVSDSVQSLTVVISSESSDSLENEITRSVDGPITDGTFAVDIPLDDLRVGDNFSVTTTANNEQIQTAEGVVLPPRSAFVINQDVSADDERPRIALPQSSEAVLSGETTQSNVGETVELVVSSDENDVDIQKQIEILDDSDGGRFVTAIDLSNVSIGTRFETTINIFDAEVYSADSIVTGESEDEAATGEEESQQEESSQAEVEPEEESRPEPESESTSNEEGNGEGGESGDNTQSNSDENDTGSNDNSSIEDIVIDLISRLFG
jgi:hypothetical protein